MRALKSLIKNFVSKRGFYLIPKSILDSYTYSLASLAEDLFSRHFGWASMISQDAHRLRLLQGLAGTSVPEAVSLLAFVRETIGVRGDVCEFGVAQGATSLLLANEIANTTKTLWLYDSFEGLPAPSDQDELIDDIFNLGAVANYQGKMASRQDLVQKKMREQNIPENRYRVVKGWVEQKLPGTAPNTVALAYLDMDFYAPTLHTLRALHEILSPGGVFFIDDYKFFSSGIERAVSEFLATVPERYDFFESPTGLGHFCVLRKRH